MTKPTIHTREDAYDFILKHQVCTIFGSKNSPHPSLWDNVALSEDKPAQGGWCPKVVAIWAWKNEIPALYPEEIFYGKVPGGDAVLMTLSHLQAEHYPRTYTPVDQLPRLAQTIFEYIRIEPWYTGDLRREVIAQSGCSKSQFDTALRKLQISLNIVRNNDPRESKDQWLTFVEVYPDISGPATDRAS